MLALNTRPQRVRADKMPTGTPAWALPPEACDIIAHVDSYPFTEERGEETYLKISPIELLRLTHVCKSWRRAFSADHVWRQFDVYGVKHNICAHFVEELQSLPPDEIVHMKAPLTGSWPGIYYEDEDSGEGGKHFESLNRYTYITMAQYRTYGFFQSAIATVTSAPLMRAVLKHAVRAREYQDVTRYVNLCASHLLKNREFVISALAICGEIYKRAHIDMMMLEDVALAAVTKDYQNGDLLFSDQRTNKVLALAAVQSNGRALKFFEHFQDDREVIRAALAAPDGKDAISYVHKPLFADKSFILEAMDYNWRVVLDAHESLEMDDDIAKKLLRLHKGSTEELLLVLKARPGLALWVIRTEMMGKAGVDAYDSESYDSILS